jgi:microcystin-dependent protein
MAIVPPHTHPRHEHAQYADSLFAVPTGAILPYAGTVAPPGWHLCDGSAHGSADLQSVSGSATTPDLRDRFIVGAGTTYADKATGGAATVALATANMPSHSHGGTTASANAPHSHGGGTGNQSVDHTHGVNYYVSLYVTNYNDGHAGEYYNLFTPTTQTMGATSGVSANHNHSISSDNAAHAHGITAEGSGTAHENRPPYYALTYIIKK